MAHVSELGQLDLNSIIRGVQGTLGSGYDITKNPLSAVVKRVVISSSYTPEKVYTGAQLEQRFKDNKPNKLLTIIRPAARIETQFGNFDFEPYGKNEVGVWKANVVQLALYAASGVILYSIGMFVWGRHVGRKGG
jgi:hypothetical protein